MSVSGEKRVEAGGGAIDRWGRRWSEVQKRQIVSESREPRVTVSAVAQHYDVIANQVFTWRRQYRELEGDAEADRLVPVAIHRRAEGGLNPRPRCCRSSSTDDLLDQLAVSLSKGRLTTYIGAPDWDRERALHLHVWNTGVSAALYVIDHEPAGERTICSPVWATLDLLALPCADLVRMDLVLRGDLLKRPPAPKRLQHHLRLQLPQDPPSLDPGRSVAVRGGRHPRDLLQGGGTGLMAENQMTAT